MAQGPATDHPRRDDAHKSEPDRGQNGTRREAR